MNFCQAVEHGAGKKCLDFNGDLDFFCGFWIIIQNSLHVSPSYLPGGITIMGGGLRSLIAFRLFVFLQAARVFPEDPDRRERLERLVQLEGQEPVVFKASPDLPDSPDHPDYKDLQVPVTKVRILRPRTRRPYHSFEDPNLIENCMHVH